MKLRSVLLSSVGCSLFVGLIACSSGTPLPVPADKSLASLTATEASSLCSWETSELANVSCNGKPVSGLCGGGSANFASCGAKTAGDFQQCAQATKGRDAIGALQNCFSLICVKKGPTSPDAGANPDAG